jgi:hypothetical protein
MLSVSEASLRRSFLFAVDPGQADGVAIGMMRLMVGKVTRLQEPFP